MISKVKQSGFNSHTLKSIKHRKNKFVLQTLLRENSKKDIMQSMTVYWIRHWWDPTSYV